MSYYTLSVIQNNHDASIALFEEDRLIYFVQSERILRKKYTKEINTALFDYIYNNITKKINLLVFHSNNVFIETYIKDKFNCEILISEKKIFNDEEVGVTKKHCFSHHSTHAISAFYMSPFEEAVCLIVDGYGSGYTLIPEIDMNRFGSIKYGLTGSETTSILEISNDYKVNCLYKKSIYSPNATFNGNSIFTFSHRLRSTRQTNVKAYFDSIIPYKFDASSHIDIGMMYDVTSVHLFGSTDYCGKTMGLSAYGKPNPIIPFFLIDGTILSNRNLFAHGTEFNQAVYPHLFNELSFQEMADLAYEAQKSLEKVFLHHAQFIIENSKIRNLIVGGGCALNILGVSLIKKRFPEFNIYVDPIAHDATHSIGIGIHYYNSVRLNNTLVKQNNFNSIYTGPKYELEDMKKDIDIFLNVKSTNVI